jgi:hypothetical protein
VKDFIDEVTKVVSTGETLVDLISDTVMMAEETFASGVTEGVVSGVYLLFEDMEVVSNGVFVIIVLSGRLVTNIIYCDTEVKEVFGIVDEKILNVVGIGLDVVVEVTKLLTKGIALLDVLTEVVGNEGVCVLDVTESSIFKDGGSSSFKGSNQELVGHRCLTFLGFLTHLSLIGSCFMTAIIPLCLISSSLFDCCINCPFLG